MFLLWFPVQFLAAVTDNATNNDTLMRTINATWKTFDADEHRVRCVAHIIHLAVNAFLTAMNATPPENDAEEFLPNGTINKVKQKFLLQKLLASD